MATMELGNMFFGNSRGEYPLRRGAGFEEEFERLNELFEPDGYVKEYENDVFSVFPYWWGDCTCGAEEDESATEHHPDCVLLKPNFLYKPMGFEIQWYKYPFRDSYTNQKITLKEFSRIIDACIASLEGDGEK